MTGPHECSLLRRGWTCPYDHPSDPLPVEGRSSSLCGHPCGWMPREDCPVHGDHARSAERAFYAAHDGHDVGWRHEDGWLHSATCHDCGDTYPPARHAPQPAHSSDSGAVQ